ncbi:MAG: trypsin-like peptidase domain-containing protein [Elusimicrobia bacterium]|nr:trypsin-like peptidase domain-containing protein [Elusimicrobiota bacterium]
MKKFLFAAVSIVCAAGAQAQFDGRRGSSPLLTPGQFRFQRTPAALMDETPQTRMVRSVKGAVVEVLAAFKWSDMPDAALPPDLEGADPLSKAMIGQMYQKMSPEKFDAFAKKNKIPRVSRDKLPTYSEVGSGTGFIVKAADGRFIAITNAHVANMAAKAGKTKGVKIELHVKMSSDQFPHNADSSDMIADVGAVGKRGLDVAFLKIPQKKADGKDWAILTLADSSKVDEGEEVWAMGFPMGLTHTTTHGIVSAAHVNLNNPYVNYLQTDAAINPGNSGGPLVRQTGGRAEVVGMNTQILSESGGSIGLGFAIETNDIKRALNQYLKTGSIDVGYVGMVFGAGKGAQRDQIVVQSVSAGGPAAKAGLAAGDVIKSAGGKEVAGNPASSTFQVSQAVKAKDPGESVEIVVSRGGKDIALKITVEKEPESLPKTGTKDEDKEDGEDAPQP